MFFPRVCALMWHIERRMIRAAIAPRLQLFVCANHRVDSPLGPGCGDAGEQTYAALKAEVARLGAYRTIWVTKTHCLGVCPKRGCTVAIHPPGALFAEVDASDAAMLVAGKIGSLP
jgi:(2Fe-2S) ferredoxin